MKKIIYTVILDDTDDLKEPYFVTPGWDYVCITDNPNLSSPTWGIDLVESTDSKKDSRFYKITNQFPTYDTSIYIDATFEIRRNLDYYINTRTKDIWLNKHPMRSCAYEEAQIVIDKKLDAEETVANQILKYQFDGFPPDFGMWRCGTIIRDPKSEKVNELCELWNKEVQEGSWRDQISFPYACWKVDLHPRTIPYGLTESYFKQSLHKCHPTDDWKFLGEGDYDKDLITKYSTAHLIILRNGILFPKWINNYISLKNGTDRFVELVRTLNGIIVRA